MAAAPTATVESLVVVHNVAKRHNVGTLARSAIAFGVSEIVLVGRRDFNAFGSHGSTSHLRFRHFPSLSQARLYLKEERDCDICGVEITDGAISVAYHPFNKSTAFLLGNEVVRVCQRRNARFVTSLSTSRSMVVGLHHSMSRLQHQLFYIILEFGQAFLKEAERETSSLWLRSLSSRLEGTFVQIQLNP